MFRNTPKFFAHKSVLELGNFVTPEFILNGGDNNVNLFRRHCPHRMYPLSAPGQVVKEIECKFHGFKWDQQGVPINNDRKLNCGTATIGKSNLIFKDFVEPEHFWVDTLASETNLKFSHAEQGSSKGSWLWMMDIQADLLHIRTGDNVIHPYLSTLEDLDDIDMHDGDGWILQTCSTGWWLFLYPYTFIEWSKGCLSINYTTPKDPDIEFGFDWITQFYFDPNVSKERREEFVKLEDVFHEDVQAIEAQKGSYYPLITSSNRLEDHCVHFGKWVQNNRL